jgi:hypothetical protein
MTVNSTLLALLQLPSDTTADDLKEVYDQKLFDARQDLLQKFAVPSLLRKKIKLIEPFAQLELASTEVIREAPFGSAAMADKIEFLEHYELKMSELRMALSSAKNFAELCKAAGSLALQQDYYMVLFTLFFSEHYSALPEEVNTRDMIDTGKLIVQLKAGNPDDKMAWEIEKELARIQKIHQLL